MISVTEARSIIKKYCSSPKIEIVSLNEAGGFVLAETLYARIDMPGFNQSAMDGYAFSIDNWDGKSHLNVIGEVQAGNHFNGSLKPLEALRIFTGAALPATANTIAIQENVTREGNQISIKDQKLIKGKNVRLKGSQTKKGDLVLKEGHLLTPASVSFLAGLGISEVKVFANPSISIITTGRELVKPGKPLCEGKIYDANTFGLKAALDQINIIPTAIEWVDDDEQKIIQAVQKQLFKVDIIILTGGVSVGDYDFVSSALEKCNVQKLFHKVKQKPGKPIYFGTHYQTMVFGLPGNPASALTCFYEYVADSIACFTKKKYFKPLQLPLGNAYSKKDGFTFFLKGKTNGYSVYILNDQESYKMNSFAIADCLIELDEERTKYKEGDYVSVRMII